MDILLHAFQDCGLIRIFVLEYNSKDDFMNKMLGVLACLLGLEGGMMAQERVPILRFGLFADVQYADCFSENGRFYRESLAKLDTCVDEFNRQRVEFTINLGDIIDRKKEDLKTVLLRLSRLNSSVYHLTGNHDYKGTNDNESLYRQLDMPAEYYSFRKKDWVFVMLNTNEISAYAHVEDTPKKLELDAMLEELRQSGGAQAYRWNGGISQRQMQWLDSLLTDCDRQGNKVLVFSHHPVYPPSEFAALNDRAILEIMTCHTCVKAVFSGHHHAGAFGVYKGIPMITQEGMVETEKQNAYAVVEITSDSICVKGYGRVPSRSFSHVSK